MKIKLSGALALGAALVLGVVPLAYAQKKYDQGATDTQIKIGHTTAYSGPASMLGEIGKVETAYFKMINDQGGVNGRKIEFLTLDDGYSPAKTLETVRQLVERDGVLLLFNNMGTAPNSAIEKYVNDRKIPHLLHTSGANKWFDTKSHPWSISSVPSFKAEASTYARQILKATPNAKIAILYQNDDFGKDLLKGFTAALGDKASTMIVAQQSSEITDPTVNSQLLTLAASGADVLVDFSATKAAAQAVRRISEMTWKPTHYIAQAGATLSALTAAGLENSVGVITVSYLKDPQDPAMANDPGVKAYLEFMKKYASFADPNNALNVFGYYSSELLVKILRQAGDNLTRENIMALTTNLKNVEGSMLRPGVLINTSPSDYDLIKSVPLVRFDGTRFVLMSDGK